MRLKKKNIKECLYKTGRFSINFIPCIFMLVIGMLTIHYTVKLINFNHAKRNIYQAQISDLASLQKTYDEYYFFLMNSYHGDLSANETDFLKDLTGRFVAFSDFYGDILIKDYEGSSIQISSGIFSLKNDLQVMQYTLAGMVSDKDMGKLELLFRQSAQIKAAIDQVTVKYLLALSADIQGSSNTQEHEIHLYWSVLAMAFCGFLLVLLNGDKLRHLSAYNEERQQNFQTLQDRLAAMEAACEGIMIVDSEGMLTYLNGAMSKICMLDDKERYLGDEWTEIFSENDLDFIAIDILPHLEDDGFWIGEFPIERYDGSIIQTEFSLTQLPEGGLIATAQDVTQKHIMEQEKRDLEDQFYQAQKMEAIGRLAGGVAHDFNNILAAISGFAEFLVDDLKKGSEEQKYATNIIQASGQAKDLVDQMLTFSRHNNSAKDSVDLVQSVEEIRSMLSASLPKNIEINTEIADHPVIVIANHTQISQMIMNLCVNASDAMEESYGTLTIKLDSCFVDSNFEEPEVLDDDLPDPKEQPLVKFEDITPARTKLILGHFKRDIHYARLHIGDTGGGISRVIMEHMFEPFFTTKDVDKGTGLGLATVHGVVVGHSGAMVIDSELMKGTAFTIYIPLSGESVVKRRAGSKGEDAMEVIERDVSDYKILLVEDQANVREMTMDMLTRMGFKVETCTDGLKALVRLRKDLYAFDLVVTDHNMPKMTGLELVENIYRENPDLPFVFMSGYSEEEMQKQINYHPAVKAILKKPVSKAVVSKKIWEVLRQNPVKKAAVKKAASNN